MKNRLTIVIMLSLVVLLFASGSWAGRGDVYIAVINDAISPGIAEYINNSIERAEKEVWPNPCG